MKRHLLSCFTVVLCFTVLSACSSGGSGDSSTPPTGPIVTFDLAYPGSSQIQKTVVLGSTVMPPPDPTYSGHTFITWCDDNYDPYNFNSPVTDDITIYARWVENPRVTLSVNSAATEYTEDSFFEELLGTNINDGELGVNELYTLKADIYNCSISVSQNYDDTQHSFLRRIHIKYLPQPVYENQYVHYIMEQERINFSRDGRYLVIKGDSLGDSSNPRVFFTSYDDNEDVSVRTSLETEGYGTIRISAYGYDAIYVESTSERLPSGIYVRD